MTESGNDRTHDMSHEDMKITRSTAPIPTRIGRYTIKGVIASGGMGTVYKAVQENPRRAVAVKVMRGGVSSPSELRRFEFEAQLLGRLRHPGIAQIYEAGTHEEGGSSVPFFAMEYIPNAKSLLQFAQDKKLNTRDRIELFGKVCEAVHHGHQKGIIHRDLKPDNILVGPNGTPRIIDFGVARATDSDMALTQHQTDMGQLIGTVQYMSPEQCDADPHDIDTRSDVYSLGLILYELLCGKRPYEVGAVPVFEAARLIRDQAPPRPSTINSRLRGDLETIVMKALEKDRDRRYQSAGELAQDTERFLRGDAITARPPSTVYQLRVFARRNKGLLAALSTIGIVVIAGVFISTSLYFKNREQEAKTRGAHLYLQDIISAIGTIGGDEIPIANLLNSFGENIEERFKGEPEAEAQIRLDLAQRYNFLAMYRGSEAAREFIEKSEHHLNRALDIHRELYGETDPRTLDTLTEVARHLGIGFDLEEAEAMLRNVVAMRETHHPQDQEALMRAKGELADVLVEVGKVREASALSQEVLAFYQENDGPWLSGALSRKAWIQQLTEGFEEAEAIRLAQLESLRETEEVDSGDVRAALGQLANVYVAQGKLREASELYREAILLTPERMQIHKWLEYDYVLKPDAPTLLLFWEEWCPFCQLYLPEVDAMWRRTQPDLQVVGLTSESQGKYEEDALSFIRRNKLNFPNASFDYEAFGVTGFPYSIAVVEGQVVWQGHPNSITPGFLNGLGQGRIKGS